MMGIEDRKCKVERRKVKEMYCQNCGHKVKDDDSFCVNCGAKLSGSSSAQMNAVDTDADDDTVTDSVTNNEADMEVRSEEMPRLEPITALKQMFENRPGDIKCGEVVLSKDVRQDETELKIKVCTPYETPLALFGAYEKGDFKGVLVTDKRIHWNVCGLWGLGKWHRGSIPHEEITNIGIIDTEDENLLCVNDHIVGLFATGETWSRIIWRSGKFIVHERALSGVVEYFRLTTPNPIALNTHSRPIEWMLNGSLGGEMPVAYATWAIVALCILGFVSQLILGSFESDYKLVKVANSLGAETPIWGWLVCGFLHGGIFHIGLNLVCIVVICPTTERIFGMKFFVLTYLASILAGGASAVQMHPDDLSVGADGGLFGVMTAVYTFGLIRYFINRKTFHDYDRLMFWKDIKGLGILPVAYLILRLSFEKFAASIGISGGMTSIGISGGRGGVIIGILCGIVALVIIPKRRID